MSKNLASTLALSAAGLFLAAACNKGEQTQTAAPGADQAAAQGDAKVKCLGINECKGQTQCDMPTHSCAGQNECKAKGWILVAASECSDKGGTPKT